MARSAESGQSSVLEATTLAFPKVSTLQDLAKVRRETKARMNSQSGIFGSAVKEAVRTDNVDRKALQMILTLAAMEDEDLHVTMFHLIHGCKALGILKRAMAQEEMFTADEINGKTVADAVKAAKTAAGAKPPKANGKDKKPKPKAAGKRNGNVVHIGDAARTVAEQAGADK